MDDLSMEFPPGREKLDCICRSSDESSRRPVRSNEDMLCKSIME
jgi:hypothetical protein